MTPTAITARAMLHARWRWESSFRDGDRARPVEAVCVVRDVSKAYARVIAVGALFSTALCALAAHAVLGWLQALGWISGEYGSHDHGSLGLVGCGLVVAGAGSLLLYVLHTIDGGPGSEPTLARALCRQLDWRAVVLLTFAGCAALIGMETGEQLAARHFDGILSALGGQPAIGLAVIGSMSFAVVSTLRTLCVWLAASHGRIVIALFTMLKGSREQISGIFSRARRIGLHRIACACTTPHIFGKRAPPQCLAAQT